MQTISIPFHCSVEDLHKLQEWRRVYSAAVRTAHKIAATATADGFTFADEKAVRDAIKARFAHGLIVDAWLLHCATRDGIAARRRVPSGATVFGGKDNLLRRSKGLISAEEWRAMRLRPLLSLGDKTYKGNRHFRLSPDARRCTVRVYGRSVALALPELNGIWGKLLPMVARLAAAGEINVTFRLGKTLDVTFDELDLRRLPPGLTLQAADDAARGERKARGRPRGTNYAPPPNRWEEEVRPVHPEWRAPVLAVHNRALGIDLNPNWVGITVVSSTGALGATEVLDYRLITLDLPQYASNEVVREVLSGVVNQALSLARAWNVGVIGVEDGLGKLRSGGKSRSLNRLINFWARNALLSILERRCALAGLAVRRVWAGYSTIIGNTAFAIPDACASAAEIARRSLLRRDESSLPEYDPELVHRRWKDDGPVAAEIRGARTWLGYAQGINAAKARGTLPRAVGVRRPHPALSGTCVRSGSALVADHVVSRLGHRHRPGLTARPVVLNGRLKQLERRGTPIGDSTRYSG